MAPWPVGVVVQEVVIRLVKGHRNNATSVGEEVNWSGSWEQLQIIPQNSWKNNQNSS